MSSDGQMADNLPLVSVVICVYNAGEHLRPSVESVLAQTYRNVELLIVDDGSTDGCMDSIADLHDARIRIITQGNRGKPAAMNVALGAIRGEFYALNDADDLSAPHRIEAQLMFMRDNPDVAAVFCGYELIIDGHRVCCVSEEARVTRAVQARPSSPSGMPSHDPTAMYRVSYVKGMRYDEALVPRG